MKINCVIDTCSCIYLSNAEFGQKPLLKYLNENANLSYSKEVKKELHDHKEKNLPSFIHNYGFSPTGFSISEYERRMTGKVLPTRKKGGNKGEIDNFLISVDKSQSKGKLSIIFISDDTTALNGLLKEWLASFPKIHVWTSYEVILFLYAEKIIPSKDIAIELIRDIIAITNPKDRSPKLTSKLTALLQTYNQRVENISKLLN